MTPFSNNFLQAASKETLPVPPFFRMLRHVWSSVLDFFSRCAGCSLCSHITPCSAAETQLLKGKWRLQRSLTTTADKRRAAKIMKDTSHPAHSLGALLSSRRRLRSLQCWSTSLRNSFFSLLLYDFRICWCSVVLLSSAVWPNAGHQEISNYWMCVINPKFSSTSFIFRVMRGVYCTPL